MALKGRNSKRLPRKRVTRAAHCTPTSRARKTSSSQCSKKISRSASPTRKLLAKQHDVKKRIEAFRQLFMEKARERSWALLWLEFKLFALRHPEFKARLSEMRERVSLSSSE